MRARTWTAVTLASAFCLGLLAAKLPVTSGLLAGAHAMLGTPAAARVIRIGEQAPALPDDPTLTTIDAQFARGILGSAVRSATDEDMGRIIDVVVDRAGDTRAVVIDFGGFLGVGSRKIAIDWNAIRFDGLNRITLDMTRDQVKAAPEYIPDKKTIAVLGASPEFARSRMTERTPEP